MNAFTSRRFCAPPSLFSPVPPHIHPDPFTLPLPGMLRLRRGNNPGATVTSEAGSSTREIKLQAWAGCVFRTVRLVDFVCGRACVGDWACGRDCTRPA